MPHYNRDPKRDHNFDNHPLGDPITQLIALKVIRDHTLLSVAGFGTTGRVESLFSGFIAVPREAFIGFRLEKMSIRSEILLSFLHPEAPYILPRFRV